jgi:class 3 adenylate cyclase
LDIAQSPTISDVEIAVCFFDIRGFTRYCNRLQERSLDTRIQNFLREFLAIFSLSVLETIWRIEPSDPTQQLTARTHAIRDAVVPTTYKNLGDGIMLVWELPRTATLEIQGRITHAIFYTVMYVFRRFYEQFDLNVGPVEIESFAEEVKSLKLGAGLTRGHAWKLDFGQHLKLDYAGSVVNLAARLQGRARPDGVVCQRQFSQALFDKLAREKIGTTATVKALKGLRAQPIVTLRHSDIAKLFKNAPAFEGTGSDQNRHAT